MTEAFWQARIDLPGTIRRGTGFLVSDRHVVTCAHVVRGHEEAQVTLRDGTSGKGVVLRRGPWWTPGAEEADVAVVELSSPVGVLPAPLAPYACLEIYAGHPLDIFGFPDQHRENGVYTDYAAEPHHFVGADIQLKASDAVGVRLQEGFSGAAVVHRASQQVVGMVRKAATGDERIGLMVPVGGLAAHCPALGDHIRLGLLDPPAYRELRAALESVRFSPERLRQLLTWLRGKVPGVRDDLTTLLAIVEALVVDTYAVDDRETRYHLVGLLAHLESDEALGWAFEHFGRSETLSSARRDEPRDGGIVVCLEPTAGVGAEAYRLKVWTVTEPDGFLEEPVSDVPGLARDQWQERVELALAEAFDRIPPDVGEVTVEFVLPRMLLSEPVDEWTNLRDDDTALGVSTPVVVRDLDWFHDDNSGVLARRAEALRDGGMRLAEVLRWRDCSSLPPSKPNVFKAWLRKGGGPFAVGLAGEWAQPAQVSAAVGAGPPVLLWRRHPCPPGAHEGDTPCVSLRFVRDLTEQLADVTIDDVARRVRDLRIDSEIDDDSAHCGSGLVLLRDDARRRPMPLGFAS